MFDWKHYRYVAQELAEKEPNDAPSQEAKLRASISRAYYAAYCKARNGILAINGMTKIPDGVESNTWVLKQYRERRDEISQEIRRKLSSLKDRRVKVDYENPKIEPADLVQAPDEAIMHSANIISLVTKLRKQNKV